MSGLILLLRRVLKEESSKAASSVNGGHNADLQCFLQASIGQVTVLWGDTFAFRHGSA